MDLGGELSEELPRATIRLNQEIVLVFIEIRHAVRDSHRGWFNCRG
jgi:hypothetical protein